jgi:hypothetical protein
MALTVLGVSACGSGSKSSSSSGSSQAKELPRAEFAQKADEICKRNGFRRQAAGPAPTFDPATVTQAQLHSAAKYLANGAAVTHDDVTQVSALGEPSEKAPKQAFRALRGVLESKVIPGTQELSRDARRGDVKAFRAAAQKLQAASPLEGKLAAEIGLKVCGA